MKKIQVIFAVAALLLAVVGVFANKLVTTTYYQSTSNSADCTTALTLSLPASCDTGTIQPCFLDVANPDESVTRWYFSKIVDSNPCEQLKKP